MGGDSILGGLILGAIAVFVIDRRFNEAAYFTFAGAALTQGYRIWTWTGCEAVAA
jgi:adenine/guanine/hypoxanthine permease